MRKADNPKPGLTGFSEHLLFVAWMVPTFVVLVAAAVSLAHPDPSVAAPPPVTLAICEPCLWNELEEGP